MAETSTVAKALSGSGQSHAGENPLRTLVDIVKDKDIPESEKEALIKFASERFKNRRRMAYIALSVLVGSVIFLFLAAFIDGLRTNDDGGILGAVKNTQTLLTWLEAFMTSIVGAYYGVSAFRPSS